MCTLLTLMLKSRLYCVIVQIVPKHALSSPHPLSIGYCVSRIMQSLPIPSTAAVSLQHVNRKYILTWHEWGGIILENEKRGRSKIH